MTSILPSRVSQHQRLPSDDDLQKTNGELQPPSQRAQAAPWKGKGKAVDPPAEPEGDSPREDDSTVDGQDMTYPPVQDDETETRRVEQNLRLWEQAERQRRRTARDAQLNDPSRSRSSIIGDITRSLWTRSGGDRTSYTGHHALQRDDSGSGLAADSPSPSPSTTRTSLAIDAVSDIPEPHTPGSASPSTLMEPSPRPPSLPATLAVAPPNNRPPVLQAMSLGRWTIPRTPSSDVPMSPTPHPNVATPPDRHGQRHHEFHEDGRWWTEWLCGCREDKTDEQGGATNPFE